jgi:hypothetical protein
MTQNTSLGATIEGLKQIEDLLWESFILNNHILDSKDLYTLSTNEGNPDYGSIISQAGAISRQYHPQIDGIQKALQSSNLSDNRAKELHAQRIEVIERFDRINQLSKGFHLIQKMQAPQNQSLLLGIEAPRQVFDSYSPTQQNAVRYVLKQALLKRDSFQEQTDMHNTISDLCALSDATRPASTQETPEATRERAAGAVASFVNALQGVQRFISGGDRSQ